MYEEVSHGHYPSMKCLEIHFCIQQPNETCNSLTWLIMVQYILEMWPVSFPLLEREDLYGLPPNCRTSAKAQTTTANRNSLIQQLQQAETSP